MIHIDVKKLGRIHYGAAPLVARAQHGTLDTELLVVEMGKQISFELWNSPRAYAVYGCATRGREE